MFYPNILPIRQLGHICFTEEVPSRGAMKEGTFVKKWKHTHAAISPIKGYTFESIHIY